MLTTYYNPHISGLTLYFERLAEEYVKQGHKVTVLTTQHDKNLPTKATIAGVEVIRTPYLFKINKGMLTHRILLDAYPLLKNTDVIHFNLPSIEALPVALLAKVLKTPIVSTYVCDITLPNFTGSKLLDKVIDISHYLTLKLSDEIASFTTDFAKNSRLLKRFKNITEVYPIVEIESYGISNISALEKAKKPRIGMATRIAADKGIEYMVNALPEIHKDFPDAELLIAGTINAVGEEEYLAKLQPLFKKDEKHIKLLGQLSPSQMPFFFKNIDVLVVASTNSTEAFGMVQVEAMFEGTPVVATNLPGVRVPAKVTGMGEIAKIGDSHDLAEKVKSVLKNSKILNPEQVRKIFSKQQAIQNYLNLYKIAITKKDL